MTLDAFFAPNAVVVVGASTKPGKIGYEVLRCVVSSGFRGNVYPINPGAAGQELLGKKCLASVRELPENAQLAVLVVGADRVPETMEECARAGVKAVVIISGGFKELGGDGAALEARAVEAARSNGMRVIGPNGIGISSSSSGLETFFQPREMMLRPGPGPVAILSQSGTFGATLLEWFAQESIGVSKFASLGNKSDVDETDLIEYLAGDTDTRLIVIYAEGILRGREFAAAAASVGKTKPIILFKGGRTAAGARATLSHTGSVAGQYQSIAGAMAQSGVIVADDVDQLFDIAKLLLLQPLPAGGAVAMATNGAGPCVLVSDLVSGSNTLSLATLTGESTAALKKVLPHFCVIGNPVDLTGSADDKYYLTALEQMSSDHGVDIMLPVFVFQDAPLGLSADRLMDAMAKVNARKKTMLAIAGGGPFTQKQTARLQALGIPVYPTATRAVRALEGMVRYARWRKKRVPQN